MTFAKGVMGFFTNILKARKIQIIILVLITVLTYSNALQNGFAWDDHDFLFYWPSIKDNGNFSVTLSLPSLMAGDLPSNHLGVYRPIRSIFYILSFKIYGTNPFGYHLQAIFVHLSAVLLIYFITRLIINKPFVPFMTAILFATHPIHTESVSFITASFDTVGVVFLLLAFYLYLRVQVIKEGIKAHYIASYIYTFFAFFTYEMTLVLPLLIILYDFCFKRITIKNWLGKGKTYVPYFIILVGYVVIRFLLLKVGNRADYLGSNFLDTAVLSRIEMPEILLQYFSWLIFPINLTIGRNAPENFLSGLLVINNSSDLGILIANSITKISVIIPIFTNIILIFLILKIFSQRKEIAFSLSWIIISLFTVLNIVPQGAPWAERYLYLPSFGFSLLTAYLYYKIYSLTQKTNFRKLSAYLLIIILFISNIIFYSGASLLRNQDWANDQTLFSSILKLDPNDHKALSGLGLFYIRQQQPEQAIAAFKKAASLAPSNVHYLNNLALAYEVQGDLDLAIDTYKESVRIAPKYDQSHLNLANLYLKKNQDELAFKEFQTALELNSNNDRLHYLLGAYYDKQRNYDLAIKAYKKSFDLNPNRSKTLNSLGLAYINNKQADMAILTFKMSLEINPNNSEIEKKLEDLIKEKTE